MKRIFLSSLLALATMGYAQTDVSSYIPGKSMDAVTYFLPKSVIEIKVEAVKVTYTPGEFCKYADRYLRLIGLSDKASSYWEIGNISVQSVGIPNPDQIYSIKLKEKSIAPLVELTQDGIIKSINRPAEKEVIPATPITKAKTRINPRELMTEEMLMASSTAKMAELVAKEIYNIRESKNAIIRGQADNMPKDGEALKLMLANLEEQGAAMMEMFTGITTRETKQMVVQLIPNKDFNKEIVFRFSRKLGLLDKDDLAGNPIFLNLTNLNIVPAETETGKEKKKTSGVVYNIPGKAQVTIYAENKKYVEQTLPVTQFGNQEVLANDLFNKNATTRVTFDPNTGGLRKIDRE